MRSLKTQLSLAFMLVVLITVSIISFFSNTLVSSQFESYITKTQTQRTDHILSDLSLQYNSFTHTWNINAVRTVGMDALEEGYIIKVYNRVGENIWDAENHDMTECKHIMDDITSRMKEYGATGNFASHKYTLTQNGQEIGSVTVSYFGPYFLTEGDFDFISSLNTMLMIVGVSSLLFSFIAGLILARRIARPVTKTAEIAGQIAAGKYDIQFESGTKMKELLDLVSSVNHLANALSKQENLRKRLTADVAHELRTPLAALGTHTEAMIDGIWQPTPARLKSCHEEILRLGKMVMDLERLERADSDNLKLDKTLTDLLALTRSVCENFAGELSNKNLRLDIDGMPAVVSIDKDRTGGVIGNLMSNAVKYTSKGGHIQISVRETDSEVVLTIEDSGAGIPENELPFIFERFYRADKSRNRNTGGAGIGLAIVKSVIAAHGGTVVAQSKPNKGSKFVVTFPKSI
ncbi:MAG: GHKL domain-containing protein [Elusimicrobiota bacterium]|jgi:signal transduction histidine kinase|nr:GHKL domain-containing protein [Elusimicrobiota bacterium]